MEVALDAGADDVVTDEEGVIEVTCATTAFAAVRDALQAKGLVPEMADIVMKPNNEVELYGDDAIKMQNFSTLWKLWMMFKRFTPTPSWMSRTNTA